MWEWFESWFGVISTNIINLLPDDPFKNVIDSITFSGFSTYLGWLNWFFPCRNAVAILTAYLVARGSWLKFIMVINWGKLFKQ